MEQNNAYIEQLIAALGKQKVYLDTIVLPEVSKQYSIQITAIKAIRSKLLNRGAIHDDPYKYDSKMTEIELPQTDPFSDKERSMVIGSRLAHYQTMLEFLGNYYQFNSDFLTPRRMAKVVALNKTFMWEEFSASTHPNTKSLSEIIQSVSLHSDSLSASLLRDSLRQLTKTAGIITSGLKTLAYYHRETYKLKIRQQALAGMQVSEADLLNPSKIMAAIKKRVSEKMKGFPFYTELVLEVLKEDFSQDSDRLRQEVLRRLETTKKEKEEQVQTKNMRSVLATGLRILGGSANHILFALRKIEFNQDLLIKSRTTLFSKFITALKKAFNIKEKPQEIPILIRDPASQEQRKERLIFDDFKTELIKKIRLFQGMIAPNSPIYEKLSVMANEQLFEILATNISEVNVMLRRLDGLDEYYKTIKPELRSKIKGVKIEITTITNSVIKANQCRAEYSAYIDEIKHMKQLGLTNV
ncbi:hypothetical protein [Treponema phagedenis]|uniref:hypothetical protein n=1 Tax=Treponema phagedenis TaxID=162 RepID=UPI0011EE1D83|nr:hypothetical protein [Treponema phagedenis]TYT78550.1 hypothetical protein FS559_05150 [Treponema phagedenis]